MADAIKGCSSYFGTRRKKQEVARKYTNAPSLSGMRARITHFRPLGTTVLMSIWSIGHGLCVISCMFSRVRWALHFKTGTCNLSHSIDVQLSVRTYVSYLWYHQKKPNNEFLRVSEASLLNWEDLRSEQLTSRALRSMFYPQLEGWDIFPN